MYNIDPEFEKVQQPGLAVDIVLFTIKDDDLKIGLIKRKEKPHKEKFALPGRFVRYEEPIEETAAVILKEKCGVDPKSVLLEQLYTFGQSIQRDTRIRTVSIVYMGLINSDNVLYAESEYVTWHSVFDHPSMGFDHKHIIEVAVQRLQKKIIMDTFIFGFMPTQFTLTQLQKTFEIILQEQLDKRNFRKKIMEQKVVIGTGEKMKGGTHRPAELFVCNPAVDSFNLK